VELRRRGFSANVIGEDFVIYCTKPKSAVVARGRIIGLTVCSPNELWKKVGGSSGCTKREFFDYYRGTSMARALHLDDVTVIEEIPLKRLLGDFNWRPPVSWCTIPRESGLGRYLGS
jgi:predicted transcriptional regulator